MNIRSRRIGTFKISSLFYQDLMEGEGTNIFSGMVVLRTEQEFCSDFIRYFAIHESFRKVTDGEMYPEYEAVFDKKSAAPRWIEKP